MAKRKTVRKAVDKKIFSKQASRTHIKNIPGKNMMRGGFHF